MTYVGRLIGHTLGWHRLDINPMWKIGSVRSILFWIWVTINSFNQNCMLDKVSSDEGMETATVSSVTNTTSACCFNSLRPRQSRRHFADDISKCIFLNKNARISLKISLKFVPKIRINNIPALVQIMAWRRPGDKSLSEPMMVRLPTHICVPRSQWVKQLRHLCPLDDLTHCVDSARYSSNLLWNIMQNVYIQFPICSTTLRISLSLHIFQSVTVFDYFAREWEYIYLNLYTNIRKILH